MLRRFALAAAPAACLALIAGCHHHGPGGHAHADDGGEVAWSEGLKEDPRPTDAPAEAGRVTDWWGIFDRTQNVGTRRVTQRPLKTGGHELVVETDWYDGNVNDLVRVRGTGPRQADDVLVKSYAGGVVKRELQLERESAGAAVVIVRDKHHDDVRRVSVPPRALTFVQLPGYVESPAFAGESGGGVTLLDTEGLIATWAVRRAGTARIVLHGTRTEAAVVEAGGDAIDGHTRAVFYLVAGRVELIALGERPLFLMRASRAGARQDLEEHPLGR